MVIRFPGRGRRLAIALPVVLALILVIGTFGGALRVLSSSATRDVAVINGHLAALGIGETVFAEILGRLSATPWEKRWFKGRPDQKADVAVEGGSYSYVLADTVTPAAGADPLSVASILSARQADLMIWTRAGRSPVNMFWRLSVPELSVDGVVRIIPVAFTFVPEGTPVSPSALGPISTQVNEWLKERARNQPDAEDVRARLRPATTVTEVERVIGGGGGPGTVDELELPGQPPRRGPDYLGPLASAPPPPIPLVLPRDGLEIIPNPVPMLPPIGTGSPPPTGPPPPGMPTVADLNALVAKGDWIASCGSFPESVRFYARAPALYRQFVCPAGLTDPVAAQECRNWYDNWRRDHSAECDMMGISYANVPNAPCPGGTVPLLR